MLVDDQHELLAFLADPASYPAARGDIVDRIETHSAVVFLVGDHAYKLKRAVRYDYLDFSTPERRRHCCEAEVVVNRRTAPGLYLGVVPVTRDGDGHLALDGAGTPIDWLVHMRRFADDQLLDRMAARRQLGVEIMPTLADAVARLHAGARRCDGRGGADAMRWVEAGNTRGLQEEGAGLLDDAGGRRLLTLTRHAIQQHEALLDARGRQGWIRECHGDLHLRNIALLAGQPTPFDAVEFNRDLSCIDVLYDLAFLLMDLWRLDLRAQANALFNRYVARTFASDDCAALGLLPLFLSCRSAVRAKTSVTASRLQADPQERRALASAAREYLEAAVGMLLPPPASLVVIAGLSGAGKSTVARAVAADLGAAPGALVLRSDTMRKRLAGVDEETRLGSDAYRPEMTRRVYRSLGEWAHRALLAGHAVVVDAVCATDDERRDFEAIAAAAGVRFAGVWLDAPADVLARRVTLRRGDASDATAAVVAAQVARGVGPVPWPHIAAAAAPAIVEAQVRAALRRML